MDTSLPVSAHPDDLARTIAALANSGGGRCIIKGEHGQGREALLTAILDIVPSPVFPGTGKCSPPELERAVLKNGIVRPPIVSVREEETGLIVTVTPGDSLCTVGGVVFVYEEEEIRALTLTDVVRRAGSGG